MDLTDTAPPPPGALGPGLSHRRSLILRCALLTGELAALKNRVFVLKEGVDYRVKITFKVRAAVLGDASRPEDQLPRGTT